MRASWLARLCAGALALAAPGALAQPVPAVAVKKTSVTAPGAGGQQGLTVEVREGALRACAQGPCGASSAVAVPAPFDKGLGDARLDVIALDHRRSVVRVVVPGGGQSWVALLAGPLHPGPTVELFSGLADVTGSPDATEPALVQVIEENGARQLVVGSRSGEVHLCGRPSVLSPRVLDPTDLTLKPARVQRLSLAERGKAQRVEAVAAPSPRVAPLARLLRAVGASSGTGSPGAVTDGDPETSWSEARGSDGRGEFVVMRASRDVPLVSVTVTIRPPTRAVEHGASPRRFYLVDDAAAIEVVLPEDAWQKPGASYLVAFPAPRATSCLGLVLEEAFEGKDDRSPAVTVAEVEARGALDGKATLDELVGRLDRGGAEAKEAAAMLVRGGTEARVAIGKGYEQLGDTGKLLALDAVDQGGCDEAAPFFVRLLSSKLRQEARHARTRVERCGKAANPALIAAIGDLAHPSRVAAATELALLSPSEAITALARADTSKDRRALLAALAKAAQAPRGRPQLAAQLDDASLAGRPLLDLLRAGGDSLTDPAVAAAASRALGRAAGGAQGFDERYLALLPAGQLASAGDAAALGLLAAALGDGAVPLRASAAAVAGPVLSLRPRLLALAADPEPRVRQAAARALLGQPGEAERRALLSLLADEWTFVRSAAYDALATAGPDAAVDQALVARLTDDRSPLALARAIEATGRRQVQAAAPRLRAIADETARPLDLRTRSVRALGAVCHRASIDWLTDLARAGAVPLADGPVQSLGGAALAALGRLHPPDLATRLAPMMTREASRPAALAARAALAETDTCK